MPPGITEKEHTAALLAVARLEHPVMRTMRKNESKLRSMSPSMAQPRMMLSTALNVPNIYILYARNYMSREILF